jgi:hypothetical protein
MIPEESETKELRFILAAGAEAWDRTLDS